MTLALRAALAAYRWGGFTRGTGVLFDKTPTWLWGGESVTVPTSFGLMTVPLRDHGPRQILVFGHPRNEVHETALLEQLAGRISCAFDIGANVGWYTRVLGSEGARVLAFEPNSKVFPFAQLNARALPNVGVLKVAIGEESGTVTFYEAPSSDLSSASRPVGAPIETKIITLDEFTKTAAIAPEFVKCDVEGGEMQVLRGARQLRQSPDAPVWLIEADERFLLEQGSDYEALEEEVRSTGPVHLFAVDDGGRWSRLSHFHDLRKTRIVNVLLVPERRLSLISGLVNEGSTGWPGPS